MPRDVSTHWNSTYDMLNFTFEYKMVIVKITGEQEMKLRPYELVGEEWELVPELSAALKACSMSIFQ